MGNGRGKVSGKGVPGALFRRVERPHDEPQAAARVDSALTPFARKSLKLWDAAAALAETSTRGVALNPRRIFSIYCFSSRFLALYK